MYVYIYIFYLIIFNGYEYGPISSLPMSFFKRLQDIEILSLP